MRLELGRVLVVHGLAHGRRSDIALFFGEAAANAVIHAYRDVEPGPLYAAATALDESLEISVVDSGCGMMPHPGAPGLGLGMALMRRLSDDLRITSVGPNGGACVQGTFEQTTGTVVARDIAVRAGPAETLPEYLRVMRARHDALREESAAVLAQSRQVVLHTRLLREQRRRRHSTEQPP